MGIAMTRMLTKVLAVSLVLLPLAALASQPAVKFTDLAPDAASVTPQPGFHFFLDPDRASELRIKLPRSIQDLDLEDDALPAARI